MTSKFVYMPLFERSIKHLKKRYPNIISDIEPTLETLETSPRIGSVIPKDYGVRKLRIASRDMRRGKSGGFRLLYKLASDEADETIIYLLFIYAKSEQADVTRTQLEALIQDIDPKPDDN